MMKNLPAVQETQLQSLDQEDPLEKGMATHSNILVWRIPWTEEPGGLYSSWGRKESDRHTINNTEAGGFQMMRNTTRPIAREM